MWIQTIPVPKATGALKRIYDSAKQRAGRVFNIVQAMSLSPRVLRSSMGFYREVMFAEEGLSRRQRELIAVVVSRANHCHY